MPKKRLTQLAEEYEVSFEEAMKIAQEKLPPDQVTGKGKLTWIGEEGQAIIGGAFMIDEIIPKYYKMKVLAECPNPRYNFAHCKEVGKRVPVLIPRRHQGKMVGKVITVEAVEDNTGVSYRYAKPRN